MKRRTEGQDAPISSSTADHDDSKGKQIRLIDEPMEKPSFALSGALAKDKKTGNTLLKNAKSGEVVAVSKYSPPVDACDPKGDWRIFVFKDDDCLETLYLHRKSHFILGREEEFADIVTAHPSCSKEHAVLQYRKSGHMVRLYLMDLESTNGTKINHERIVPAHYIEVKDGDVVTFGDSTREYVFKKAEQDDKTTKKATKD